MIADRLMSIVYWLERIYGQLVLLNKNLTAERSKTE
jgi:hypothetical protein